MGDADETRQQKIEKIAKQKGWDKMKTVMFSTEAENEAAYGRGSSETGDVTSQLLSLMSELKTQSEQRESILLQRMEAMEEARKDDIKLFNTAMNSFTQSKN